jgi:hypothetical protein
MMSIQVMAVKTAEAILRAGYDQLNGQSMIHIG